MSKAFTKEDQPEQDEPEEEGPAIPHGAKNYITPNGLKKLQEELRQLMHVERPAVTKVVSWAAENGDRSENADYIYGKKRLREIDRRVRFLAKRLDNIEIVDPLHPARVNCEQVFFGATVTVRFDDDNSEKVFSIVGIDEMEADKGKISWISPIASALLKAHVGDFISFKTPKGVRDLEIIAVSYNEIL